MRVGGISYCTRQGLGLLLKSFFDAGVVTDPLLIGHSRPNHWEWYPPGTPRIHTRAIQGPEIEQWIRDIDVALFFETPYDWSLPDRVRAAGKRTVLCSMYEWMPRVPPHKFDLMLCPSRLDLDYFRFPGSDLLSFAEDEPLPGHPDFCKWAVHLPVPVTPEDAARYEPRTRARRWLHSCGNVGYRFHKGTVELLKAVPLVKTPAWRLTVRAQDERALGQAVRAAGYRGDPRVTIDCAEVPRERLYADHDVLIAPEKLNGLSLPLQEARAAGLLVVTTDRYPTNTWLPREPAAALIPPARYERACISDNYLTFDEAVLEPAAVAAAIDALYDADIAAYSASAVEYNRRNSWGELKPLCLKALSGS